MRSALTLNNRNFFTLTLHMGIEANKPPLRVGKEQGGGLGYEHSFHTPTPAEAPPLSRLNDCKR